MDTSERAANYFESYNCAQSVYMSLKESQGLNPERAAKITAAFGGGIIDRNSSCGAVSGALMFIGEELYNGPQHKDEFNILKKEFVSLFENKFGCHLCKELIGESAPHDKEVCRRFVKEATKLAIDFVNKNQ